MIPLLRRLGTCAKHLFKSYFDNTFQMSILSPKIPLLEAFLGDSPIPEEREERQRKPIPAVHFKRALWYHGEISDGRLPVLVKRKDFLCSLGHLWRGWHADVI